VVYDRYYFDFIIDPKRTNLRINQNIAKFFYSVVFKPNLNVLLYAPSDAILKRKQELTKETIETLTTNYRNLFEELKKKRQMLI
jgi:hypothetical protein